MREIDGLPGCVSTWIWRGTPGGAPLLEFLLLLERHLVSQARSATNEHARISVTDYMNLLVSLTVEKRVPLRYHLSVPSVPDRPFRLPAVLQNQQVRPTSVDSGAKGRRFESCQAHQPQVFQEVAWLLDQYHMLRPFATRAKGRAPQPLD